MRTTLLLLTALAAPVAASAQTLLVENFAYPDSTVIGGSGTSPTAPNPATGWASHSGTPGQIKTGVSDNLTFTSTPAYPSQSGAGIRLFSSRGEDINHSFAEQVEGASTVSVYASVLVRPDALPNGTTGSYFLNLANTATAGTTFSARVFMAQGLVDPTRVRFGISTISNVPVFAVGEYALGTTLLLAVLFGALLAGLVLTVGVIWPLRLQLRQRAKGTASDAPPVAVAHD